MSKTLDQYTSEQRKLMDGMWCDYLTPCGTERAIYSPTRFCKAETLFEPGYGHFEVEDLSCVTPRFDLPRAWGSDGQPVPGEWADGHMWWGEDTDTMQTVDLVGAECLTTGEIQGFGEWPEGVTPGEDVPVRRYITEWEEMPNN